MSEAARRKAAGWPPTLAEVDGMEVRTTRDLQTGMALIPTGTRGRVHVTQNGWHLLHFTGAACAHCGVQPRLSRCSWFYFEVIK